QPPALAAGERADVLLLIGATKVEAAEVGARGHLELAYGEDVLSARDRLPGRFVVRERLARLVDDGELHGGTDEDLAAIGLLLAGDHAEERGLAGAVGPDHADDRARGNAEGEIVDQQVVPVTLADALEFDHRVAQPVGHRDEDLLRLVALLVLVRGELLEAGDAGL